MPSRRDAGRPGHYVRDDVVRDYDVRYRRGLKRWKHRRKLAVIRRWLEGKTPVLEVACGPGRLDDAFESCAVHLDRSVRMLLEYRRQHPGAKLVVGDAKALPFGDARFDAVVAIRFVSHLRGDYRAAVLREMVRVSRRWVILDARHRSNLRYWSRWLRVRLGLARADKLRHSTRELREELAEAGLAIRERRWIAYGLSARVVLLAERVDSDVLGNLRHDSGPTDTSG